MSVTIITGKSLAKAIKGFGATVATFSAKTHQLAASALAHVEEHHCTSHLNALYAVTPLNYRGALRIWSCDLGKVQFLAEPEHEGQFFTYAKSKPSDMPKAMDIGPVEYKRAESAAAPVAFNELAALESFLTKLVKQGATPSTLSAVEGAIRLLRTAAVEATPAAPTKRAKKAVSVVVDNTPAAIAAPVAATEEKIAA